VRRDREGKKSVPVAGVVERVAAMLAGIQAGMLAEATAARDARIVEVSTVEDALAASETGWGSIDYQLLKRLDGEARLREQAVTVRCLRQPDGSLPPSEDDPDTIALVAKAY
jgi:prolyl-tRNA synthetase